MPPALAVVGRTHLLLLHFPIAVLFTVLAVEVLLRKRIPEEKRKDVTGVLLGIAALGALVAMTTGLIFSQSSDEKMHGHVQVLLAQHRVGGIVCAVLTVAAFIAQRRADLRVAYLPFLVAACAAVTFTGHRGGEMVHGEGYILDALNPKHDDDDQPEKIAPSDGDDPVSKADKEKADKEKGDRQRYPEGKVVEKPDYKNDIKPIIERSCVKCHGPEKRKSGLRLDKKRYAMKGGETGPAIVPGDVEKSLLTKYIQLPNDDDDVMPSKGKLLAQSEIETLKNWVKQGAEWPDD